jgi:hypothetical protein
VRGRLVPGDEDRRAIDQQIRRVTLINNHRAIGERALPAIWGNASV